MKTFYCQCLIVILLTLNIIVIYGAAITRKTVLNPLQNEYQQEENTQQLMWVSGFCPCSKCCGPYANGITASGYVIKSGDKIIAAPKSVPFGTRIFIPGYGIGIVRDRGKAITGNRLDIYFGFDPNSNCTPHEKALQWGRRKLIVLRGI